MSNIRTPIALRISNGELVNAKDIHSDDECDWICFECGMELVGVNREENKQEPHFRHFNSGDCKVTGESYLHWVTKEVFKQMTSFKLPSPTFEYFNEFKKCLIEERKEYLILKKIPFKFDHQNLIEINFLNQTTIEVNFSKVKTEVNFNTEFGVFRADIVIELSDRCIIIEPFLTSEIDEKKLKKLNAQNSSVLSINLNPFKHRYPQYNFLKSDLELYLHNDVQIKKWVTLEKTKLQKLEKKEQYMFKKFVNQLEKISINFNELEVEKDRLEENLLLTKNKLSDIFIEVKRRSVKENNNTNQDKKFKGTLTPELETWKNNLEKDN